jgi:L-malate glycosyltransferase
MHDRESGVGNRESGRSNSSPLPTPHTRLPLHVCYVIDSLSHAGTELQLLSLIRSLDRSVIEPSLVLLNGQSPESRSLEPLDCPILRLGLRSFKKVPATLRAAARLRRFWKREQIDVVQTYFLDSTYFGVLMARALGIRRVVRVRNNLGHWLTPTHRVLGRVIGRLTHATITNSDAGRDALRAAEKTDAANIAVLENGIDLARFESMPLPRRSGTVTIGAMANLRPVKGLGVAIRAVGRLLSENNGRTRLLIAGEGEQRFELETLIANNEIGDDVRLLGRIRNVTAFITGLDIAVVPSHAEGMSNSLLEFMAAGRPIVATAVGGNSQLIGNNERGLLVPPGDPQAMAEAIMRLINDESLAANLGAAAREYVCRKFSREKMSKRFEEFYLRMCG